MAAKVQQKNETVQSEKFLFLFFFFFSLCRVRMYIVQTKTFTCPIAVRQVFVFNKSLIFQDFRHELILFPNTSVGFSS